MGMLQRNHKKQKMHDTLPRVPDPIITVSSYREDKHHYEIKIVEALPHGRYRCEYPPSRRGPRTSVLSAEVIAECYPFVTRANGTFYNVI